MVINIANNRSSTAYLFKYFAPVMTTTEHICDLSNFKINNHFFLHMSSSGNKLFSCSIFVFIPEANRFRTDCLIGLYCGTVSFGNNIITDSVLFPCLN